MKNLKLALLAVLAFASGSVDCSPDYKDSGFTTWADETQAPAPVVYKRVDYATRTKTCFTLPLPLIVKARFLDKSCYELVDAYGQINQQIVNDVKHKPMTYEKITDTPFYREDDAEWHYQNDKGEDSGLTQRILLMEKPYMNDLFLKFQKSGSTCAETAKEIEKAFEAVETPII